MRPDPRPVQPSTAALVQRRRQIQPQRPERGIIARAQAHAVKRQGEIDAVTVADFDPVDFEVEWDRPMQSRDRDGKIGGAQRALEGPREPVAARSQ